VVGAGNRGGCAGRRVRVGDGGLRRDIDGQQEHDGGAVAFGQVIGVVGGGRGVAPGDPDDGNAERGGDGLLVHIPPPRTGVRACARDQHERHAGETCLGEAGQRVGEAGAVGGGGRRHGAAGEHVGVRRRDGARLMPHAHVRGASSGEVTDHPRVPAAHHAEDRPTACGGDLGDGGGDGHCPREGVPGHQVRMQRTSRAGNRWGVTPPCSVPAGSRRAVCGTVQLQVQ